MNIAKAASSEPRTRQANIATIKPSLHLRPSPRAVVSSKNPFENENVNTIALKTP